MAKSTSLHISIGDAAAGAYTKQEIVSIPLKAVRCLLTGAKRKIKKKETRLLSFLIMCKFWASDDAGSQTEVRKLRGMLKSTSTASPAD